MNLLPATEKEALKKGFKLRFAAVFLFILSILFIVGIVFLLPAYILTPGNMFNYYSGDYSSAGATGGSSEEMLNIPAEIDSKTKLLQNILQEMPITEILQEIVQNLPQSVSINSINFSRDQSFKDKKGSVVTISGMASNRDSLVGFASALQESDKFSDINMPVSNLAKGSNLPYTMYIFIGK